MVLWRVVLEAFPGPARIRCRTVLQIGSPAIGKQPASNADFV